MKTIGITGGTGFVGTHLTKLLVSRGYKAVIFTRNGNQASKDANVTYALLDASKQQCDTKVLASLDGIVHLAGAGVADKRWSVARKKEIVDSRVIGSNFLVTQLKQFAPQCTTFIAASATGFYGPDSANSAPFTETSPSYNDFLGDTCQQWENATHKAAAFVRTVIFRFGIVLGKESGAFPEFAKPLSFGIMPILGSGKQIVPWIEVDDLARMLVYALENNNLSGVYNAVAPNPVSQKELMKAIAKVKGGLAIPAPAPAFVLKIMLGEMSIEILKSCNVSNAKIMKTGFQFNYPLIQDAVKAILGK